MKIKALPLSRPKYLIPSIVGVFRLGSSRRLKFCHQQHRRDRGEYFQPALHHSFWKTKSQGVLVL
jgi:hypothetical protein